MYFAIISLMHNAKGMIEFSTLRAITRNTAAHNDIRLLLKINYRLFTSVIIEFLSAPQFFIYIETVDDEAKDMEINDAHDRTLHPSEQITATANMCADIIKKKKKKRKYLKFACEEVFHH